MRQLLFGLVLGLAGCLAQQPPETSVVAGNLSEVPALAQAAAPAGGPGGSSPSATAGPSGSSSSSSALTPSEPHETAASSGVANSEQPACVHVEKEHCPPAGELCRCKVIDGTASVLCCDITSQLQLKESLNCQGIEEANITGLHARNITLASLDVSLLNLTRLHLPHLESLAITDGHISELYGHLDAKNLACLNFSSNNLITLYGDTFSSLHSLENLDLSGNCLADVVNLNADVPEFTLDVSGNNNVSCGSIMELMKRMRNLKFSHDNDTYCLSSQSYSWFNSSEKIPLSSIAVLSKLEQECPKGETEACSCNNSGLLILPGKPPTYAVSVDCSNRRLTKLPPTLPKNTNSLNVNSNNISDLADLSMNEAYADIKMFHADDNQITSITALEGSAFINSFTHLSLRNNNISSLPTYILSNVFDRWDSITVHLGLNRLKCDCTTAQQLKMWLNANSKHIPDYKEVLCENMRERVFELDQTKVCTVQSDWTEYVYYIVVAEVLLLILLISKVSYDYWVFKTAGYLPWPASKMPKLPCDWVFES